MGKDYPTTLKIECIKLKVLPEPSIMQDLKDIFKSKTKKPVRNYEVNGIQIKGLSLNEKNIYPIIIYSTLC